MTELSGEDEQPVGSPDALRAELDELRRRVAVNDEEINLLQVEAAGTKRKWYQEPSVLVATLALAVSVATFVVGQVNIISDRQIQDRNRLSALIEQLPTADAQSQGKPDASAELVSVVASNAAGLMDKLGPEASTAAEKLEVALALMKAADLPGAKRLATAAEQQSTNVLGKVYADRIIANIDFQTGDAAGGRKLYRQMISLLQTPQNGLDSPSLRDLQTVNIELYWVGDELSTTKSCQVATEQLGNARQALNRLSPAQVGTQTATLMNNTATNVTSSCPAAAR